MLIPARPARRAEPGMLDVEIEARIAAGLKAGQHSQRALAREFGVSRGTVGAMASGKRPADLSRQRLAGDLSADGMPPPLLAHCQSCGREIEQPCRACRDEAALATRRGAGINPQQSGVRGQGDGDQESLTVALRYEDEQRYLELRAARERAFVNRIIDAAEVQAAEREPEELPTIEELTEIDAE